MCDLADLGVVLRFTGVRITKAALETTLGQSLERFEPERGGSGYFAQIPVDTADGLWVGILEVAERHGRRISELVTDGAIGSVTLDIGVAFPDEKATISFVIPHAVAEAVSRNGVNIEMSVYLTER